MARETTIQLAPGPAPIDPETGSVLFIGTATTLIECNGFTVLTDPNFLHAGDHAHLGYGMTSPRLTDPAVEIDALPPLDACFLSHFHGDHWDEVATARLPKSLPVLTTHHAARALRKRGFERATPLSPWDSALLVRGSSWLRLTAMPGRHGPPVAAALLPPVVGAMLEWGEGAAESRFRLYVSGDTLIHHDLRWIPHRFPEIDLGLFHLGGTRVFGVLVTMDAAQGVEAIRLIAPELAIPIHYGDYPVFRDPIESFIQAVAAAGLAQKVRVLARGERHTFQLHPVAQARGPAPSPARRAPVPAPPGAEPPTLDPHP